MSRRIIACALLVIAFVSVIVACTMLAPSATEPTSLPTSPKATPKPKPTTKPTTEPHAQNGSADWTVLVYLDGDNDLEASAIDDFGEMASVGSTERMKIVVQFDRTRSDEDWDDASNGNWAAAKRFLVEKNDKPTKANQQLDLGEVNMGDPQTLVDFVTWGITNYPAQHYALIFWDHGAAWPGIAADDTSDGDMLTLPELARALAQARKQTGVERFDLLGFDACLMSQIDVLETVAPYGEVAVGSADLEPGEGWAWNQWLKDLAANPTQDAASIAPRIVKSFGTFYRRDKQTDVTLAAFHLREIEIVAKDLDTLAGAMIDDMPKSYKIIGKARSYAVEYAAGDEDTSAIDLGYFAQSLLDNGAQGEVAGTARKLLATLNDARIAMDNGKDYPDGSGISIYFPWKKRHYDTNYRDSSPLTESTRWNDFLSRFYAGKTSSKKSQLTQPLVNTDSVMANESVTVSTQISGEDTAYVSYFVATLDPNNQDTLLILGQDYIYPPGVTIGKPMPNWPAEKTEARLTWEATEWFLSNGNQVAPVPLVAGDYGTDRYTVDGVYKAKKTGSEKQVRMEFAVSQGQGELVRLFAFDTGTGKQQSREFTPMPGDSFTPDITTYTDTGADELQEGIQPGAPIIFGSKPLTLFSGPARNGEFLIGMLVENIAGDIAEKYAELTVTNAPQHAPLPPNTFMAPLATTAQSNYTNQQAGFTLTLPAGWKATNTGSDKVTFEDQNGAHTAILAVDVYKDGVSASQLLDEIVAGMQQEQGYRLREPPSPISVAGSEGHQAVYLLDADNDSRFVVTTVTVSGSGGKLYALTFATHEARAVQDQAIFASMLASFALR